MKTLGEFLRKWLDELWPFQRAVFPGRDLSWADWEVLKDGA